MDDSFEWVWEDGQPVDLNEGAEYFELCPLCGQAFDTRDLDDFLHHGNEAHHRRLRH